MGIIKSTDEDFRDKVEKICEKNKKLIKKSDFDIFHFSVQQKFWQSQYYFKQMLNIYDDKIFEAEFVKTVNIRAEEEQTGSSTTKYEIDKDKLAKFCNLYLDGYFLSISSIFDSFAHEINILFKFLKPNQDIYIGTIINELKQKSNQSDTYKFLIKQKSKNWWKHMNNFRNTITHESIIATYIVTNTNVATHREELSKIPLPDDPQKRPFKYKKDYELKTFIEDFNKNIISIMEQCYKKLIKDLENSKKLPIKSNHIP